MKRTEIYALKDVNVLLPHSKKEAPCLLTVEYEKANGNLVIKIKGAYNPFPYKEVQNPKGSCTLSSWLLNKGWKLIMTY